MRYKQAVKLHMREESKKYGEHMMPVPRETWPKDLGAIPPDFVWRSRSYLALVYGQDVPARISVCRTALDARGGWAQNIPWEDLQRIKNEVGFAEFDAIEVYPRVGDVVNVANMRHLFVVGTCEVAWRKQR